MSEKLEDGRYEANFTNGDQALGYVVDGCWRDTREGRDHELPAKATFHRIADLDGRPVVDEGVVEAIVASVESALAIHGFRQQIAAAVQHHLCPTKREQGAKEGEAENISPAIVRHYKQAAHDLGELFTWCVQNLEKFPPRPDVEWIDDVKQRLEATKQEQGAESEAEHSTITDTPLADELPPEIKSLIDQCEANVVKFSNEQMSEALHFAEVADIDRRKLTAERDRLQSRVAELEGHLQRWNEANTPFQYTDPRIEIYQPEGRKYYGWRVKGLDSAPFTTWREAYQRAAGYLDYAEQVAIVRELKEKLEAAEVERVKLKRELDAAVEHHGRWINKLCALLPGFQRHSGDLLHNVCCEIERIKALAEAATHRYRDATGDVWVFLPKTSGGLRYGIRLQGGKVSSFDSNDFTERFTALPNPSGEEPIVERPRQCGSRLFVIRQAGTTNYWNCSTEHGCGWNPGHPKQSFSKSELAKEVFRIAESYPQSIEIVELQIIKPFVSDESAARKALATSAGG